MNVSIQYYIFLSWSALKVYLGCFCSIKGCLHQGVILCFTVLVGLVDSIQERWLSSRGLDHVAVLCHSRRVNNPQIPRGASAFNPSPGVRVMGVTRFVWALLMIRAVHYSLVYYSWGCGACGCLLLLWSMSCCLVPDAELAGSSSGGVAWRCLGLVLFSRCGA